MCSPDGRRDHRYCHRNRRPGVRLRAATFLLAVTGATGCGGLPTHETLPSLSAADPAFAATMEAYTNSPVIGGNVIDVLVNGDAIFPAKLAAIRAARTTINYAEYFYAEGQIAQEIAQALAERCRAGVTANILLDGFGTLSMASEHAEMLKAAGCRTITFRPLGRFSLRRHNNRNHRRILVVDGRVGITGGSGVSAKWTGDGKMDGHWRDTDVRSRGRRSGRCRAPLSRTGGRRRASSSAVKRTSPNHSGLGATSEPK